MTNIHLKLKLTPSEFSSIKSVVWNILIIFLDMRLPIFITITLLLSTAFSQSTVIASKDIALTIYNNNLGVVKDTRTIQFVGGVSSLNFTDVATTILP